MKKANDMMLNHSHETEVPKDNLFYSFTNTQAKEIDDKRAVREITYPNGGHYKGECTSDNQKHGFGVFNDGADNIYEGEFKNDKIEGKGIYKTTAGTIYNGEWKNDLQDGMGKETWPDGSYYLGAYIKGLKNGKGFYKWEDGSEYDGQWVNGNIDGYVR